MAKLDLNKMLMEMALSKSIRDLQTNPEQTLKRWTEKGMSKLQGNEQQALVVQLKSLLSDPNGSYQQLIGRLAKEVKGERLKNLVQNLAYYSYTVGMESLHAQELRYGVHIPWTVFFELDGTLTPSHLTSIVEQGKKLGIYVYQLFCRSEKALAELPSLFETHKDCVFMVYLPPASVTARLLATWGQHAVLPLLLTQSGEAAATAALLRKEGFLFGCCLEYDAGTLARILSGDMLKQAMEWGAALAVAWPKMGLDRGIRNQAYQALRSQRNAAQQAVLPVDMQADVLEIDRLLSKEAALLYFDGKGQRRILEEGGREGNENLFRKSFIQILEAL